MSFWTTAIPLLSSHLSFARALTQAFSPTFFSFTPFPDKLGLIHREPEHFVCNRNKCTVIYLCPCVFFGSFRRDLNEVKTVSCNVVNYLISSVTYLIRRFVIMTLRLRLKFRVTSLTINSLSFLLLWNPGARSTPGSRATIFLCHARRTKPITTTD